MINLEQLTSKVREIAIEGGKYLASERKTFQKDKVIEKGSHDYVSYVDKETEKLLVKKLCELLPEATFITEEKTIQFEERDYCWIIDPLDGTTNYINDNAPYCVSIALSYKSELLIGVIYEVCRDECFYAWKDGKAYLNGTQIHVSDKGSLNQSFVELGLPYNAKEYKPVINHLMDKLYGRASCIRINGSAASDLCYVAAGRFDLYIEAYINIWDFAAGALIVQEAGGNITNFSGEDFMKGHHIVASNTLVHNEAIKLLTPYLNSL